MLVETIKIPITGINNSNNNISVINLINRYLPQNIGNNY